MIPRALGTCWCWQRGAMGCVAHVHIRWYLAPAGEKPLRIRIATATYCCVERHTGRSVAGNQLGGSIAP